MSHMAVTQYSAVMLPEATDFRLQAGVNMYYLQTSDESILTIVLRLTKLNTFCLLT